MNPIISSQSLFFWESAATVLPAGKGSIIEPDHSITLRWDVNKYRLKRAVLVMEISQTYMSGADATIYFNDHRVRTIHWNAFETGRQNISIDVTNTVKYGDNNCKLEYRVAYPHFGAQANSTCNLRVDLENVIGTSDIPRLEVSDLRDEQAWRKVADKLVAHASQLAMIAVAVGVAAYIFKKKVRV